jgi:4-hydroxy-3-polyprenylbenzoate decarboxylase
MWSRASVALEGPFGDHTGYYSLADEYPVFHVTCITRRKNPIYMTTIVGKPPMEDGYLGKATERLFLPLMQKVLPEVVDMDLPVEGIFHNLAIVSIDKQYPHACPQGDVRPLGPGTNDAQQDSPHRGQGYQRP